MEDNKVKVLSDFEMLFDMDYGMISTIVKKYNNPKYTNDDYLRTVSFNELCKDLCNQEERDPLKLAFKDGVDYKGLYKELLDNDMEFIIENSCPTEVLKLFKTFKDFGMIDIDIICRNKYQEQKIKSLGYNIVDDTVTMDNYDCLYIKYYKDLFKFGDMNSKNIYLANCIYNYDKDVPNTPNLEMSTNYFFYNEIGFIDIY